MSVEDDDLDARMRAAGMIPIADHLAGNTPMAAWKVRPDMTDLDTFERWVEHQTAEYIRMQARYDLGESDMNDELYEWILARASAFHELLLNLRAARAGNAASG